ncbi:MAG TPA: cytochrome [Acidimicrobiia bacterium]|jgi:cytochrome P450|nr:cytochrome [Acidimicrobiia bacterium]
MPPVAAFAFPWDDPDAPDPVVALSRARDALGDTFGVKSGQTTYLLTFGEAGLRNFYAVAERDASKGIADYRMLLRKMPATLFSERRTFAHDLFGAQDVENYLDALDWAIGVQLDELGVAGEFEVFELARRLGHRLALACWIGREAPIDALISDFDILDGAEAFVHPEQMNADRHAEEAALARVEKVVTALLAQPGRAPSFLDDIAARWEDADDLAAGVTGDVVLLHVATMTNLFATLAWSLALTLLTPTESPLEHCVLEATRLGQRSLMSREVLRPITFDDGVAEYRVERGVHLATMLPVTNCEHVGSAYDPARWTDRSLHHDVTITTFGHGSHRCPAQRFSVSAIVRTIDQLQKNYVMTPQFDRVTPLAGQIGGVARAAAPCRVAYRARA